MYPSIHHSILFHSVPFHSISGHFRLLKWRYLPYIRPIFQAYVREHPQKIWPYMVQYLHFRILAISHWFYRSPDIATPAARTASISGVSPWPRERFRRQGSAGDDDHGIGGFQKFNGTFKWFIDIFKWNEWVIFKHCFCLLKLFLKIQCHGH